MRKLRRNLRAQLRDFRVLFQESRGSLLTFFIVVLLGTLVFYFFYTFPETGRHPRFGEALFGTLSLIFLNPAFPYPEVWYLQVLYFVVTILGLATVADGVIRFSSALLNKKDRGQKWQVAMASTYSDHIIICGMGKVGYRVALELLKFGREIVAIESDPQGRFVEKAQALDIPVIIADARRSTNLLKAGVERADAIIPCTDDELTNLDIALDAREINPDIKVVMRMFDPDLARRVEKGFGIHTAFSTSALAAPIFATAAMRVKVKTSFYVGDTLLNLSEIVIEANSRLVGWSMEELESKLDLSVMCHHSGQCTDLHPDPQLKLSPGDKILVIATLDTLGELDRMNLAETG